MKTAQDGGFSKAGLTRIDLLFALGTVGMLLLAAVSARATSQSQTEAVTCVNNIRRLIDAWCHYAADNNGLMTGPVHGGLANTELPFEGPGASSNGARPWCLGWQDWGLSRANTNDILMTHPSYGSLALYVNRDKNVFRCPSDRYVSSAQVTAGWTQRARSYAANIALGDGNGGPGDGPWDLAYAKKRSLSQLVTPAPSSVYVFMEEHPDSINDGAFQNPAITQSTNLVDFPGNFHGGAATIAYADGRVEQKVWSGSARTLPVTYDYPAPPATPGDEADIRYISDRVPKAQ